MKEKYIKLKSVIDILYANKRFDDSGIDTEAIDKILSLPTEEIEVDQQPNITDNNVKLFRVSPYRHNTCVELLYEDPYIPEPCRVCPTHISNGGSGLCNCTLGSPKVIC